jgi:hypothetical protein
LSAILGLPPDIALVVTGAMTINQIVTPDKVPAKARNIPTRTVDPELIRWVNPDIEIS